MVSLYARGGKRLFDLMLTIPLVILLAPLMGAVGIGVLIGLGRPVLFRQVRPGRYRRPFEILKFRTMRDAADASGKPLPDAQRIAGLGSILRRMSLDELPELWNVIRGDMSLVGPRPLLMRYLPYYTEKESGRFEVRPGITGLAQVNGRNNLAWDARLDLDVAYGSTLSLREDLRILALTVLRVVTRHGIEVNPGAAMEDLDVERRRQTGTEVLPDA